MEWSEKCRELRREVSFLSKLRARASSLGLLRNGARVRAREVKRVDVVVVWAFDSSRFGDFCCVTERREDGRV
ncbi:hypothetical protein D8674_006732 [Pyrus ussuriensis x Pyrus communis]|uniref:Uncharacterized protein n=1 Tax=Pyrus ussuriensis x Pyrus communis TaxID=2448454 RepID=A0A5N5FV41_9ROSA|nr:hypothetical protein D8674_006732 [Pyrus ussuriensis x Pyrus communis]